MGLCSLKFWQATSVLWGLQSKEEPWKVRKRAWDQGRASTGRHTWRTSQLGPNYFIISWIMKKLWADISPRMINWLFVLSPFFLREFLLTIKEYKGCKPTTIKVMGEAIVDRHYNKFQDSRGRWRALMQWAGWRGTLTQWAEGLGTVQEGKKQWRSEAAWLAG